MSKRKALKLLRNVYLVVVFTILLGGSIFIVKTHSCAYQSVKTCLSENELVQVLYEFNEQDRQDAQELTDEMVHIIGKDTAYFSVRYKEMEIKVEAGVFDSMRNGYFLGDKNPEIIGKIVTSGLYHVNYHESWSYYNQKVYQERTHRQKLGILFFGQTQKEPENTVGLLS